jgi:hypothetical protein
MHVGQPGNQVVWDLRSGEVIFMFDVGNIKGVLTFKKYIDIF